MNELDHDAGTAPCGQPFGTSVGYGDLFDVDGLPENSARAADLRLAGGWPLGNSVKALYALE